MFRGRDSDSTPDGIVRSEALKPGDLVLSRSEHDPNAPVVSRRVERVFELAARLSKSMPVERLSGPRKNTRSTWKVRLVSRDRSDGRGPVPGRTTTRRASSQFRGYGQTSTSIISASAKITRTSWVISLGISFWGHNATVSKSMGNGTWVS